MGRQRHIKIAIVLVTLLLGVAYIFSAYRQFQKQHQQQTLKWWQQTQDAVTEEIGLLQQYLNLTEERIRHSLPQVSKLPKILSINRQTVHQNFPTLVILRFIPQGSPTLSYSRLGRQTLEALFVHPPHDRITHLGAGNFVWKKKIQGKNAAALGTLEVEFSLRPSLYKNFSKESIGSVLRSVSELIEVWVALLRKD